MFGPRLRVAGTMFTIGDQRQSRTGRRRTLWIATGGSAMRHQTMRGVADDEAERSIYAGWELDEELERSPVVEDG